MLRRVISRASVAPRASNASCTALTVAPRVAQRRAPIFETLALCPLAGHCATVASVTGSNLMFTPVGTAALVVLAFNVNYVGLKHLWYTAEFPVRDYVQDVALKQALRYLLLISLLLTGSGLFVEA